MPKTTSEFSEMIDYQEAITGNRENRPVYFGVQQSKYSNFLERRLTKNETIEKYQENLVSRKKDSPYYGRVFYPEWRGEPWERKENYEQNKAFWAGIIDSRRSLVLVTPIEHYNFLAGTTNELLWLEDNGYSFEPSVHNPLETKAIPPKEPSLERFIKDYDSGNGADAEPENMRLRLKKIREKVISKREEFKPKKEKKEKRKLSTLFEDADVQGSNKKIKAQSNSKKFKSQEKHHTDQLSEKKRGNSSPPQDSLVSTVSSIQEEKIDIKEEGSEEQKGNNPYGLNS